MGSRSPTIVKAHVSPGLRVKTKPQIEHRSNWDHPENSRPSPQCGQRLRNQRQSAVLIDFEREGVIRKSLRRFPTPYFQSGAVDDGKRLARRRAARASSTFARPQTRTQKSNWTPRRAMRAGRIDAGWRKTAKLVFSVRTGFALNTLLTSRFTFVRVRPNRRTLPSRRSN